MSSSIRESTRARTSALRACVPSTSSRPRSGWTNGRCQSLSCSSVPPAKARRPSRHRPRGSPAWAGIAMACFFLRRLRPLRERPPVARFGETLRRPGLTRQFQNFGEKRSKSCRAVVRYTLRRAGIPWGLSSTLLRGRSATTARSQLTHSLRMGDVRRRARCGRAECQLSPIAVRGRTRLGTFPFVLD